MTPPPRSSSWSVVASDLDGTLLDSGRGVTKRTAKAIERVRDNDGRFLMVTGRPVRWVTHIVEQLGTIDPVIAQNGAVVWDPVSGEVTLHGEEVYVQLSLGSLGRGNEIMFRRVAGRKDYCGDRNHWADIAELMAPDTFAVRIRRELHLSAPDVTPTRLVA